MWLEDELHQGMPLNNMVTTLEIHADVDVSCFQLAFQAFVSRHEAMRTVVSRDASGFTATIVEDQTVGLGFFDFSNSTDVGESYESWIQRECTRAFSVDEQLYEAALLKLGEQRFVFYLNQHHSVTDGRSSQIMIRELDALYSELASGRAASEIATTGEGMSFSDTLVARHGKLSTEEAVQSSEYWADRYREGTEPVRFYGRTTDSKAALVRRHGRSLGPAISEKLLDLKRQVPPSVVFVTVLFAFLRRVSRNGDLCIGVPLLNRSREFTDTVGLFMEICPYRLSLADDDTFTTLLDKVRAEIRSIKPHRGHAVTSRNATYEALLNYRVPSDVAFAGAPAQLNRISPLALLEDDPGQGSPEEHLAGRDSLTIDVTHTPASGDFYLACDFNLGVWPDKEERERALDHFVCLLEQFLEDRDQAIDSVDILTPEERRILSEQWNDTAITFPRDQCLHELFEAQAERSPDAIALEFEGAQFSFRELNIRSNQLAHRLLEQGVTPGALIGVCLNRGADLIVALMATLKTGGAYVPLDPSYPQQRLDAVVRAAEPRILITEKAFSEGFSNVPLVLTDASPTDVAEHRASNPGVALSLDELAYVIFTSGSTGEPKGVMVEHRAIVNLIQAAQDVLKLEEQDRLLSATTVAFDIFALELFLPLVFGATMILASRETALDGRLLREKLEMSGATHFQATPATWRLLVDADWRPSRPLAGLSGGELLPTELAEELARRCAQLWNGYGPTEATVYTTALDITANGYDLGNIGQPLANYRVHVLDESDHLTPIGVPGELYIGGVGLARGYLGRTDLTDAQFREIPGLGRLYRTGDLARWRHDGNIEFLGRSDQQVKIRGFRVELGEIEAALRAHEAVGAGVVVARGEAEARRLVAYLTPAGNASTVSIQTVRTHLRRSLPEYMIPSVFTVLESLPLTPNGKIDRNALPESDDVRPELEQNYVPPENSLQRELAEIWAESLGVEKVGIRDRFFDLGGHSLLVLRLVTKMEQETGISVPLVDLFEGRTIEEIAVGTAQADLEPGGPLVALKPQGSMPPFFAVGSEPRYASLAKHLDAERPLYQLHVYALQAHQVAEGLGTLRSVRDITTELVATIRSVQPNGPYSLGGGCAGAVIAFDIATELQRQGEEVDRLVLWLSPPPGYAGRTVFGQSAWARISTQLSTLFHRGRAIGLNLRTLIELVKHQYLWYRIMRAMDKYRPSRKFEGELYVARTLENYHGRDNDLALGWGEHATEGAVGHKLSGTHETLMKDHSEELGDLLQRLLE